MEILVDEGKCDGCGKCVDVCPKAPRIWKMEDKNGKKVATVFGIDACLNCGSCAAFCHTGAIKIVWF